MSLRLKVAGFVVLSVFGFICCMMGVSSLLGVVTGDVLPFALPYTMGILSLFGASFFLMGPRTQLEKMFSKEARIPSIITLSSLLAIIIVAFTLRWGIVILVLVVIQFTSFVWYMIIIVPGAKPLCCGCFKICKKKA
jgi:hypothetical protein